MVIKKMVFTLFLKVGLVYSNLRATCHSANEVGSSQLPAQSFTTAYPVALGDISSLGNLRFTSKLYPLGTKRPTTLRPESHRVKCK
jgi:hypothetical protein